MNTGTITCFIYFIYLLEPLYSNIQHWNQFIVFDSIISDVELYYIWGMKCFIITIFISTILMSYGCSDKVMIKCPDNNYMSKKNINTENYYQNRRE